MQLRRAVLLGGAGFIGSKLANHLAAKGWEVIAIDGLLARTGASREALERRVRFIDQPIEAVASELPKLFDGTSLVVDCMGWTRHLAAQDDPLYDLSLNVRSHLAVIRLLGETRPNLLVYLGSRHQYGRVAAPLISEDMPFQPNDVQSVHKAAADNHYRIAAERFSIPIASLRFGNTFGPGQLIDGDDIGLVGSFIRTLLRGETLEVFAGNRRRNLVYSVDLACVIEALAGREIRGFQALNLAGSDIAVAELAALLARLIGAGQVIERPFPAEVAAIEVGDARLDETRLRNLLGGVIPKTPLTDALATTIADISLRLSGDTRS